MFLNLLAPINSLGYGVVGFNILKALYEKGHRASLFPIHPLRDEDVQGYANHIDIIRAGLSNAKTFGYKSPSVRIWHQNGLDQFVGKGERIGWPIFELDTFNDEELHHLKNVDRLFVCSNWAKEVIKNNGIDVPVDVIPLGVDPKVFYVDTRAEPRPYWMENTTVFINIGKWEKRKGHEELIQAFCQAFTKEDDVQLWMMNDNPFIGAKGNEEWKKKYLSSPMGEKIKILPRAGTQDEMRVLFNHADFGVFPSHAEGWNLEILELMACGTPCIATNYSGHTEFLDKTNSLLVEPTGKESAQDGLWFNGQGNWCSFDVEDLAARMKQVHSIRQADVRGEISGAMGNMTFKAIAAAKNFTWGHSVDKMIEVL